jgi:hypothetical protein
MLLSSLIRACVSSPDQPWAAMFRWILAMVLGGWLARGMPAGSEGSDGKRDDESRVKHAAKRDDGAVHDVVRSRRFELVDKEGTTIMILSELDGEFRGTVMSPATRSLAVTLDVDGRGSPRLAMTRGTSGFVLEPDPACPIKTMGNFRFTIDKSMIRE